MSLSIKIKPLILVGSEGSGRQAITFHLIRKFSNKFQRVISHTTRKPRPSQKNNQNFHFVDDKFVIDNQKQFVTLTKSSQGHYYGLTAQQIMKVINQNKIPIFKMTLLAYTSNIGREGSLLIKQQQPKQNSTGRQASLLTQKTSKFLNRNKLIQCNSIYVTVPDFKELQRRLRCSPLQEHDRQQRIQRAKTEQTQFTKYFEQEDIIRSEEDMDTTIKKLQSRLFQLY